MALNMRNHGEAIGRLTRDPQVFPNKDGSRKVMLTVAAQDNFKNRNGERNAQYLPFEAFVAAKNANNGVYDLLHKGDLVAIQYTVKTPSYTDGNGQTQYKMALVPENVDMLESKTVTSQRAEKNAENAKNGAPASVAQDDAASAPAPAMEEELPFGNGTGVEE